MAVDTPARIIVIGAGPIGLEAALYARYLGYEVRIFEAQSVAASVRRWQHLPMVTPWAECTSPLGWAALEAQDPEQPLPRLADHPTGQEWLERYLLPLAHSDLLEDALETEVTVRAVGRRQAAKGWWAAGERRGQLPLSVLAERRGTSSAGAQGQQQKLDPVTGLPQGEPGDEFLAEAEIVIDATGRLGRAWIGDAGVAALGERALGERIEYGWPRWDSSALARYGGRRVLVVGAGLTAASHLVALEQIAQRQPATSIVWVTRRPAAAGRGPIETTLEQPLSEADRLADAANALAQSPRVEHRPGTRVAAVRQNGDGRWTVELRGQQAGTIEVDEILAAVGAWPTALDTRELHLAASPFDGGWVPALETSVPGEGAGPDPPWPPVADDAPGAHPAATGVAGNATADSAAAEDEDAEEIPDPLRLIQSEPNFYVLGSKSFGRSGRLLIRDGLRQVRALFAIIGDRPDLDLYATARRAEK